MALVYLLSFCPESIPERLRKFSKVANRYLFNHNENTLNFNAEKK